MNIRTTIFSGGQLFQRRNFHLGLIKRLLVSDHLQPGYDTFTLFAGGAEVDVKIIVGVGQSSPKEAGWYVVCNGRVILEADRRPATGWGQVEESLNRLVMPNYHNQFARFHGLVFFDSEDSAQVPWNTTKTDVDQDSIVWAHTFPRMMEMMRPVIDFLNKLDQDIDEFTRENSPLLDHVNKAGTTLIEAVVTQGAARKVAFASPERGSLKKSEKYTKIQFSRKAAEIELLQEALGVDSAKAVGEICFDRELKRQK